MRNYWIGLLLIGCCQQHENTSQLTSVQIIDRNGFHETINTPERLALIENNNFSSAQPYAKVTRTFHKTPEGKTRACITTYHPNGHLWQYLEGLDGRANGLYCEYFPNGQLHLEAKVIEGEYEIHPDSQKSWVFDGVNRAWDREGHLSAEITYNKGLLEGRSVYFYPNGNLKKTVPYLRGKIHGTLSQYNIEGLLVCSESYQHGRRHGVFQFFGDISNPPYRETYLDEKLMHATYFDQEGNFLSEIRDGEGEKSLFVSGILKKKIEYHQGFPAGKVKIFSPLGRLESEHYIVDEKKHGDEWIYFSDSQPKMLIQWYEDSIHGLVKTWYPNGSMESQREMCQNKRQGHSFAWYPGGELMHIEEYEEDLLVKGSYMKRGSNQPTSTITNGDGYATIYDEAGFFVKKIEYKKGRPVE